MTEEQVVEIIQKVSKRFKFKYAFKYHEPDDIEQESFSICLEALEKYDGKRPLENFLHVNLNNRLFNFRRDNYKKVVESTNLEDENLILDEVEQKSSVLVNFESKIDLLLTPDLRSDYLRVKDGIKLPRVRRLRLERKIREIIKRGDLDDKPI